MTIIEKKIPRQFPDQESFEFTIKARETLYLTSNVSFLLTFGMTILLAASLKTMWNMIHFMQIIAYMRLLINWPANARMILQSMHYATTLENLINEAYETLFAQFGLKDKYDETEEQRILEENDINYENVYMSIGIFGIVLTFLLVISLFYVLVKFISRRLKCCRSLKNYLQSKLFYNVWIRYMLESNLKMTHNFIFYLSISGGFQD